MNFPEYIYDQLEKTYLAKKSPKNLTFYWTGGPGDGKDRGLNHIAHEGLAARCIGGHWGLIPKVQKLANENKCQAYNLPLGVLFKMYRDIASGLPCSISPVGLGTFIDPRVAGGRLNSVTKEDIVEVVCSLDNFFSFHTSVR